MSGSLNQERLHSVLRDHSVKLVELKEPVGTIFQLTVEISVHGERVKLWILGDPRAAMLPVVRVLPPTSTYRLAHVSEDGSVCYSDQEGIGFVPQEYEVLLGDVIADCRLLLERSILDRSNENWDCFSDEFEGYWNGLRGAIHVRLQSDPQAARQLYTTISRVKGGYSLGPIGEIEEIRRGAGLPVSVRCCTVDQKQPPPHKDTLLLNDWLAEALKQNGCEKDFLKAGTRVFLFSQTRPSGGTSLFGVLAVTRYHRKTRSLAFHATPLAIGRAWREFLLERGAVSELKQRYAIVGCGALGSRIAEMLVLSGVEDLTLVDFDILKEENLFRHVLGKEDVGQAKILALKKELEAKRPGARITAKKLNGIQWLNGLADTDNYDFVILATGNLPVERTIFRLAFAGRRIKRICSTWLEPLGLGGHVLVSTVGVGGCLECLFTDIEGHSTPGSRVALLEPGQKFSRNLTGCGGAFTPFTTVDVTRTAIQVLESVLSDSTGYRFWIGDDVLAKKSQLETTARFRWLVEDRRTSSHIASTDLVQRGCPCCGS